MFKRLDIPKILIYLSSPALVTGLLVWGVLSCNASDEEQYANSDIIQEEVVMPETEAATDSLFTYTIRL